MKLPVRVLGETGLGLNRRRVSHAVPPRPLLAITTDRRIYDLGIASRNRVVVQAKRRKGAWPEVLQDDVGRLTQLEHDRPRLRNVQVDAQVPLSGVLLGVVAADLAEDRLRQAGRVPG